MRKLVLWLLVLAVWETLSRVSPWIPSAVGILQRVAANLTDTEILSSLGRSLLRMAVGFLGVFVLGIGTGLLLGKFRLLDEIFGTAAMALHAMPGAAWVPLAVLLFGLTQWAVIFTVLLGATGIVMVSTSAGIKEVPPLLLRAARTMGARGAKIFWHVVVPSAVPRIVDGLRLAWAFGWRALMAGELMIGSLKGMGEILSRVAKQRDLHEILAFMIIIAVVSVVIDHLLFRRMERLVKTRWGTA
ncbi:MAG: ABC transporter permease subunit [Candidatus Omnitrophota bacterium]|nr:ABC transporter permease subunit [Candidatus Omnitrophota bacterium]